MDAESEVFDQEVLGELKETMGDMFPKVISSTIASVESLMGEIETALQSEDGEAVFKAAHSLKSVTAQVGAMPFSGLVKELEAAARAGQCSKAGTFFPETQEECEKALALLKDLACT